MQSPRAGGYERAVQRCYLEPAPSQPDLWGFLWGRDQWLEATPGHPVQRSGRGAESDRITLDMYLGTTAGVLGGGRTATQ
jgi:hypothetical protein